MKKMIIMLVVVALVMAFASPAFAARPEHPPTPGPSVNVAPLQAAGGLHTAYPNLDPDGIAFHVLLYRVGPGPHCPAE